MKDGVTIGDGTIVGMGSVVTKDVAPYSIVAGNPAILLRIRFKERIIGALHRMRWRDLSDCELARLGPLFSNPELMLKREGYL